MTSADRTSEPVDPLDLEESNPQPGELRRAATITALVGIAHSVMIITAVFAVRHISPGSNATDEELRQFVSNDADMRILLFAGIYLIPFAGIAFVWFTVALRMWLETSINRLAPLYANVLLVCGIIYVCLLFAAGASFSVLGLTSQYGLADTSINYFRQFPHYGNTLLLVFAMRMAAMTVFTMSNLGRTRGILPRWFSYIGFLIGVVLLFTASLSPLVVLLFPVWILGFSLILLEKAWRLPRVYGEVGQRVK